MSHMMKNQDSEFNWNKNVRRAILSLTVKIDLKANNGKLVIFLKFNLRSNIILEILKSMCVYNYICVRTSEWKYLVQFKP